MLSSTVDGVPSPSPADYRAGTERITVPAPSAGSAQIAPPCASTILRQTARPIPDPGDLLAVRALEHREDLVAELRRDAHTVVADTEQPRRLATLGGNAHLRRLVGMELQPTRDEVLKHATELCAVATDDGQLSEQRARRDAGHRQVRRGTHGRADRFDRRGRSLVVQSGRAEPEPLFGGLLFGFRPVGDVRRGGDGPDRAAS